MAKDKHHPLDRDGDGEPGGSLPAAERLPADLLAEAARLNIEVDRRWGVETLEEKIAAATPALPSHVVLLADRGVHLAGQVLRADADLISALDVEGTPYRAATPREVSLAGL